MLSLLGNVCKYMIIIIKYVQIMCTGKSSRAGRLLAPGQQAPRPSTSLALLALAATAVTQAPASGLARLIGPAGSQSLSARGTSTF